jgi:prolyl-tRNA editing enzyme YbaK/EbsC (Cys-tRNA(Pro) deacylase)
MQSPILTPDDLQAFMDVNEIPGEIVFLDVPTPTVEAAAQAVGSSPTQIVKSVLFTIPESHVLAITSGTRLIEQRTIAAHFGVGRKRVKLAPPETVQAISGYPVGTVPPFGHKAPIQSLIDLQVLEMDEIYAGGGASNALVRLHPEDILRITQADVLDLHNRPEARP